MIGLDTNVLVRALVDDDAPQAVRARAFLDGKAAAGEAFFVGDVVLAELAWVLERHYRFAKASIVGVIEALLETAHIGFESGERVERALQAYRRGGAGFADYLLAARAAEAGCDEVVTFDEGLLAEDGFRAP